jgi:hypothetical protein
MTIGERNDPVSANTVTASNEGLDSRRWWALGAVSLAAFMTYLDSCRTPVKQRRNPR